MSNAPEMPLVIETGPPDDGGNVRVAGYKPNPALPPDLESRRDQIFPKLEPAEIDRLRRFGKVKTWQAVVFLASHASHVHLLIRGDDLGKSMSRYLVDRIASLPNVTLHAGTEIVAFDGCAEGVCGVRLRNRQSGKEETKPIRRVFLFVGADPNTGWLANCGVKVNDKGFVCTGIDLAPAKYARPPQLAGERHPFALETSVSGVFAIGDVRASSRPSVSQPRWAKAPRWSRRCIPGWLRIPVKALCYW